jgi:hypothetical protein
MSARAGYANNEKPEQGVWGFTEFEYRQVIPVESVENC